MARTTSLEGMLPLGVGIAVSLFAVIAVSGITRQPEPPKMVVTTAAFIVSTTTTATTTRPATTPGGGTETLTTFPDLIAIGKSLAARNGCAVCHISTGAPTVGPEWAGLYGTTETLTDGSPVEVDDAYLIESILDPNAKIVDGYSAGVMPQDFGEKLSDDDVAAIVAYIQSLG